MNMSSYEAVKKVKIKHLCAHERVNTLPVNTNSPQFHVMHLIGRAGITYRKRKALSGSVYTQMPPAGLFFFLIGKGFSILKIAFNKYNLKF